MSMPPPGYRPEQPHRPDSRYYYDHGNSQPPLPSKSAVDVSRLSVNVWALGGFLLFLVSGAAYSATQLANIQNSINSIKNEITNLTAPINQRIAAMEREMELRTISRWTKADHELFCARTEQANPGWKCGNHIINGGIAGRDLESLPSWKSSTVPPR